MRILNGMCLTMQHDTMHLQGPGCVGLATAVRRTDPGEEERACTAPLQVSERHSGRPQCIDKKRQHIGGHDDGMLDCLTWFKAVRSKLRAAVVTIGCPLMRFICLDVAGRRPSPSRPPSSGFPVLTPAATAGEASLAFSIPTDRSAAVRLRVASN